MNSTSTDHSIILGKIRKSYATLCIPWDTDFNRNVRGLPFFEMDWGIKFRKNAARCYTDYIAVNNLILQTFTLQKLI